MKKASKCVVTLAVCLPLSLSTANVGAQEDASPDSDPIDAAEPGPDALEEEAEPASEMAPEPAPAAPVVDDDPGSVAATGDPSADAALIADAEAGGSPVERPGKTYRFVGARYRGIIVPKFMMNLFGDGGDTVYVHSAGAEFAIRKDDFEYNFGLWFASYAMDETPFKASADPESAWEVVSSEINAIYLTADFLWSQELSPYFAFNYGLGAGFGFIFGDLFRTQAYPDPNEQGNYLKCDGIGDPSGAYCNNDNQHYAGYTEPSWADGGSKPIVFPWFVLQTGLRFKPHRNFVARLDLGFGTSGFFWGLGLDYGL